MAWRVARSLETLREQANRAWPNRNRRSDGTIGDANHRNRKSDHNPWVPPPNGGVVTALDLTHDPDNGADMGVLSETIKDDWRVKYVIWNRRIWNPSVARRWRPYRGSNPHTAHMHVSVVSSPASAYDSAAPWRFGYQTASAEITPVEPEEDELAKLSEEAQEFLEREYRDKRKHGAAPTSFGHLLRFHRGVRANTHLQDPEALGRYVGHGVNQGVRLSEVVNEVGSSIRGLVTEAVQLIREHRKT